MFDNMLIRAEALGEDCIAETEDDPINASPCEGYPYGWVYEPELCQCVAPLVCDGLYEDENTDENGQCMF